MGDGQDAELEPTNQEGRLAMEGLKHDDGIWERRPADAAQVAALADRLVDEIEEVLDEVNE